MDKLAEALQRLTEEDMLHVVQLVHEQKTQDTYVKNDVESESSTSFTRVRFLAQRKRVCAPTDLR